MRSSQPSQKRKPRPIDVTRTRKKKAEPLLVLRRYGRNEACSMLLAILASSAAVFGDQTANPASYSGEVRNTARRAFFEIGGRAMGVQRGLQGEAGVRAALETRLADKPLDCEQYRRAPRLRMKAR